MKKLILVLFIIIGGCSLPQDATIPVKNATTSDWDPFSYWYFPWGESGVHKGIDIFGKLKTPVMSSVSGLVVYTGKNKLGGNVVAVLDRKWRIHYYAHLNQIDTHMLSWASEGETIGKLGNSGNAMGKQPHLHYSVLSLIPNPIEITLETQGWKRMFYVSPSKILSN